MPRPIRLNAFDMNCVAHQSPGLWRHPDDRAADYRKLSYWTELAQLLERGRFDGLFIADVLGIYDVYGGGRDATVRQGTQVPVNDPAMLVSAMAAVTEHLGFGLTASISFEHPYPFARRMSTLDHLSDGRVGWNVVTSYLDSGARNLGDSAQLSHDNRYDVADEYLEVCYKLWEGSWEDGAVLRDRESGVFTDPDKVHGIGHEGEFFKVPGIHLAEPSPQRSPVIYQAGASDRGRQFAAEHAEAIFTAAPTKEQLAEVVGDIRARMKAVGRDPYDARIYTLMTAIVDETREKAWAKQREFESYASDEGALTLFSGWMGIDLAEYDLDDPIGEVESNAIQSAVRAFQQADNDGREWKVRDIAAWGGVGGLGPRMVGSAAEVADQMQEWVEVSDVDGFNLAYAITPGTFVDIVEHLIPELQRRGVHRTEYEPGTLREQLFGAGPRLPESHPGAGFRDLAKLKAARAEAAAAGAAGSDHSRLGSKLDAPQPSEPARPLAEQIAEWEGGFIPGVPADVWAPFLDEQAELDRAGRPPQAAQPGVPMPDGELLHASGEPTSLTRIRNGRPAVVVFYRGAWCPYCNLALRDYERRLVGPLAERGIPTIAVSPQLPDGAQEMRREARLLGMSVVSDPGNQIAARLGILTEPTEAARASQRKLGIYVAAGNADGSARVPMPTVALVDGDGYLRWIDVQPNYTNRTEPEAVLAAAETLSLVLGAAA